MPRDSLQLIFLLPPTPRLRNTKTSPKRNRAAVLLATSDKINPPKLHCCIRYRCCKFLSFYCSHQAVRWKETYFFRMQEKGKWGKGEEGRCSMRMQTYQEQEQQQHQQKQHALDPLSAAPETAPSEADLDSAAD